MRARVPSGLAIAQIVLRIVSSGCGALALVMLVYCSVSYAKHFPVGYVAAVLCPLFDFVEAVALMDRSRRHKRAPPGYLVLMELALVALCTVACITIAISGVDREYYVPGSRAPEHPEDPWQLVAAGLLGGAG
ncbi:hypothetical protein C8A05DRAFT_31765 [Staphylotrichum tortipilum]|uniref:Uncharacterized protein n=1 Tax=Staphylotrichum tortipilum TaxID=2831512 RepID=A0AAN6MQ76_9PEZI|nr:hypothetical protein C8A05DRAFT_31765 [Staphylotrichum longicolle]